MNISKLNELLPSYTSDGDILFEHWHIIGDGFLRREICCRHYIIIKLATHRWWNWYINFQQICLYLVRNAAFCGANMLLNYGPSDQDHITKRFYSLNQLKSKCTSRIWFLKQVQWRSISIGVAVRKLINYSPPRENHNVQLVIQVFFRDMLDMDTQK